MSAHLKLSYAVLALLAVSACSHIDYDRISNTANPSVEISQVERERNEAFSRHDDVLSPVNYEKAQEALDRAREKQSNNKDNESILEDVAISRAYLKRAEEVRNRSQPVLDEVIQARSAAMAANAQVHLNKEFTESEKQLREATLKLEDGNAEKAEKIRAPLKAQYLDLELRAIKIAALDPAKELIKQAKNEGAEKDAPRTLAETEKVMDRVDSLITVERHNDGEISRLSKYALNQANRLLKLTREAKVADRKDSESLLLEKEAISQRAEASERVNESVAGVLASQKQIEKARSLFSENEAEVLQDRNKLIIRLKSLNFPIGKDYIEATNYPILNKVQNVLRELNPAKVTLEGHTDAEGTTKVNKALSEKRALAVKQYLISNDTIEEGKVSAIGYGYTKPLSANKSKAGRAQNRRVDIVIEPAAPTAAIATPKS